MYIGKEEIEHVARLARIELGPDEEELFIKQLDSVLKYFDKLNELDTDDVDMACHTWDLRNVFREDVPLESLPRSEILANAPEKTGNAYKVPRVIE